MSSLFRLGRCVLIFGAVWIQYPIAAMAAPYEVVPMGDHYYDPSISTRAYHAMVLDNTTGKTYRCVVRNKVGSALSANCVDNALTTTSTLQPSPDLTTVIQPGLHAAPKALFTPGIWQIDSQKGDLQFCWAIAGITENDEPQGNLCIKVDWKNSPAN